MTPSVPADTPAVSFRSRLLSLLRTAWFHLAAIVSGIALGLLGPFGTFDDLGLTASLVFWTSICWLNAVQAVLILAWLTPPGRDHRPRADLIIMLAAAFASALPCTAEVWLLLELFDDPVPAQAAALLMLYAQCLLITLLLCAVFRLMVQMRWTQSEAPTAVAELQSAAEPRQGSNFTEQIPARIRGSLVSVSAEDHYLKIVTQTGEALVAGRFSTALSELAAEQGLQIHRSHWVAHQAITRVKRQDGRTTVKLCDGRSLPVSRSYTGALRELGW